MCIDMRIQMRTDMPAACRRGVDMCIDMPAACRRCMEMRMDMRIDMRMDTHRRRACSSVSKVSALSPSEM